VTAKRLVHAVDLSATWESIVAFADDPRCDNMMAAGFALSMLARQGWEAPTRFALGEFSNAMPKQATFLYSDTIEASVEDGEFRFDTFFSHILRLPTACDAAIVVSIFYAHMIGDGRADDAKMFSQEVRQRVQLHMRPT
jgi:hypothetical protein